MADPTYTPDPGWPTTAQDEFSPCRASQLQDPEVRAAYEAERNTPDPADAEQADPYTDSADVVVVARALCPARPHLAREDARAVLDVLVAAGWQPPAGGEPDLWQYGRPDPDEGPDAVMIYNGEPRSITPRMVCRPMRAVGPWQPVPTEVADRG